MGKALAVMLMLLTAVAIWMFACQRALWFPENISADGALIDAPWGRAMHVAAEPDRAMQRRMRDYCETRYGTTADVLAVPLDAIGRAEPFEQVPCGR